MPYRDFVEYWGGLLAIIIPMATGCRLAWNYSRRHYVSRSAVNRAANLERLSDLLSVASLARKDTYQYQAGLTHATFLYIRAASDITCGAVLYGLAMISAVVLLLADDNRPPPSMDTFTEIFLSFFSLFMLLVGSIFALRGQKRLVAGIELRDAIVCSRRFLRASSSYLVEALEIGGIEVSLANKIREQIDAARNVQFLEWLKVVGL